MNHGIDLKPTEESVLVRSDKSPTLARASGVPEQSEEQEQVAALQSKYPGRFLAWFASTDITQPDAAKILEQAVKSGARGLGELKGHVEAAGPEIVMRRFEFR